MISVPRRVVPEGAHDESLTSRSRRYRIEEELLRACFAEGMTREDILALMNIGEDRLAIIEKRLLANDGQRVITMSAAHRFYIFVLQQEQCARDLDYFVEQTYAAMQNWNSAAKLYGSPAVARKVLGAAPTAQPAILAIKAKSEIFERTLKMGQELGIVQKRAKEIRVSGNINLAACTTEQLRENLQKKLVQFEQLVTDGELPDVYQKMLTSGENGQSVSGGEFESEQVVDAEFTETDTRSMDEDDEG